MSKPTEIIYVDETIYNEPPPSEASGMKKGEWRELAIMHYRTAYILKSKYDELLYRLGEVECYVIDLRREKDELSLENARLAADLESLKNLLKMKIAGGGGGGTPLEGTGGIAYGVGGEVPKDKIILFSGGAGGESPSEQTIEDNPDFTQKGGDFMKGKSESTTGIVPQGHTSIEEQIVHSGSPQNNEQVNPNGSKWDDPANNKGWEGIVSVPIEEYLKLSNELTKVQAELEKVKGENYILSTPISQEPLIAKDIPCTCDWQKVYPHLSVLCNPSTCKKTK